MAIQAIYVALVSEGVAFNESIHNVQDIDVFSMEIAQNEGDFASCVIDVKRDDYYSLSLGQWVWVSFDVGTTGLVPQFNGRLIAIPDNFQEEVVRLRFVARPVDWVAQKEALAATLKTDPVYWDPVFINEEERENPDTVLEARPGLWDVDRVDLQLRYTDITLGEAGTFLLDQTSIFGEPPYQLTNSQVPLRTIEMEATVYWEQIGQGEVDLTPALLQAAKEAGSGNGRLSSYTGPGLEDDWPRKGQSIGSGWEFGETWIKRGDGREFERRTKIVVLTGSQGASTADFPLFQYRPYLTVRYDASRSRTETVQFTLEADVQAVLAEPGEDEALQVSLASTDVAEAIDPGGAIPIVDPARSSYFKTDRGQQSLQYLISVARARLLERARAVTVRFECDIEMVMDITCRHNVYVSDSRLIGGDLQGKVKGYAIVVNGDSGEAYAVVSLGCMVGNGGTVSSSPGTPSWAETGYVDEGYQVYTGQSVEPISGEVTYDDFSDAVIDDDGIDFNDMNWNTVLLPNTGGWGMLVINGENVQEEAMDAFNRYAFGTTDQKGVVDALNELYTEIDLNLIPLQAGPFETVIPITVSLLQVAKTVDLGGGT